MTYVLFKIISTLFKSKPELFHLFKSDLRPFGLYPTPVATLFKTNQKTMPRKFSEIYKGPKITSFIPMSDEQAAKLKEQADKAKEKAAIPKKAKKPKVELSKVEVKVEVKPKHVEAKSKPVLKNKEGREYAYIHDGCAYDIDSHEFLFKLRPKQESQGSFDFKPPAGKRFPDGFVP